MVRTFQSRLSAKINKLSQKLIDNTISLTGVTTDVIRIFVDINKMSDPTSIKITDIDIAEIVFPALKNVPMRRFLGNSGQFISANDAASEDSESEAKQPFECYSKIDYQMDFGTIILKFFENPTGSEPWVLPLKIANVLGTFGSRSIQWNRIDLVYYDNPLAPEIFNFCQQLAVRRGILQW
jgi:hypothetical protein